MSRDDSDTRFRTPSSTIDALKILARAEFNLGNPKEAQRYIEQAKTLTDKYNLPYLSLELSLLELRLYWKANGISPSIETKLDEIEQELNSIHNPEQVAKGLTYQLVMLKADMASSRIESNWQKHYINKLSLSSSNQKTDRVLPTTTLHLVNIF